MKNLAVPLLVLIALAALATWGVRMQTPHTQAIDIKCPDPVAGCLFMHDGLPARLQFSTHPEMLKAFGIRLAHPKLRKVSAMFEMANMNMGFNRYDFHLQPNGVWIATVTLPVCTDRRVDWIMELNLDGAFYRMSFNIYS